MPRSTVSNFIWKERSPSKEAYDKTNETLEGPAVRVSLPSAAVGQVVPFIIGRKRIVPNLIWIGGAEPVYETKEVVTKTTEDVVDNIGGNVITSTYETTTTVTTKTIVGYSVHMALGLALGPNVHLRGIYSQDLTLWEGDAGPLPTDITLETNETAYSELDCVFYGGNFDQQPDETMLADEDDTPGYVGTAYILLKNVRSDLPLDNITFELERFPDTLSIGVDNMVGSTDLNLSTILAEVLTNEWGAGGLDIDELDLDTFLTAAGVMTDEANGGSMLIASEDRLTSIISVVQDQMDSILFPDISNGKLKLALVRPELVTSIRKFGRRNVLDVRDVSRNSWSDTVEQLRGSYINRSLNYETVPVFILNSAKLTGQSRGRRTGEISYPLVHSQALAQRLLARDLKQYGFPAFNATLVVNRDGADVEPGDVVQVSWPKWPTFVNVVVLVLKVRKSIMQENTVYLTVQQLYLPDMENLTDEPAEGDTTTVDYPAVTPPSAHIMTAPYWMARARGVSATTQNPSVPAIVLPEPANAFQFSFDVFLRNKPGSLGDIRVAGPSSYSTFGKLVDAVNVYDGFEDGVIPTLQIYDVINTAYLTSIGEDGVRGGLQFMIIGNEILSFETAEQLTPEGIWELTNVHRGLLDTIPFSHSADADVFIIGNNYLNLTSGFSLPLGYTPEFGIRSNTIFHNGLRADDLVTDDWTESQNRVWAPLRPHDVRIDGDRLPGTVIVTHDEFVIVEWKTRSRTSLVVPLQEDAAETGEVDPDGAFQQHRVFLIDAALNEHDLGITDDTAHANELEVEIPNTAIVGEGLIAVRAVLNGRESRWDAIIPVIITSDAARITEDGDTRITEDGATRIIE